MSQFFPVDASNITCPPTTLHSERLLLRQWQESDFAPFAQLNADLEVMRYFPAPLSREQSDASAELIRTRIAQQGWGLWALERKDNGQFIGFTGLAVPRRQLPFMPCVEIGWRLAREAWRQGYASEAARVALAHGFEVLDLAEIVSFTALTNLASQAVMRSIGMRNANYEFEHPALEEGSPLRRHCLYRLSREEWRRQRAV